MFFFWRTLEPGGGWGGKCGVIQTSFFSVPISLRAILWRNRRLQLCCGSSPPGTCREAANGPNGEGRFVQQ